ncbi:AraC family transcriptional regulator [Sphingomonas sp. LB-2]|uniref:AraC family transcriptional regulator n=1 Tax=Sphingomonas caeni TaxID=2984949 RepID=UPI00222F74BD|nr:AraC family transcriptional regulator [Sphingomonas caeni]MCW3848780.1 AraC family transcriptional regulator [Sphingomonas caeni]
MAKARASGLAHYVEVAESVGLEPDRMLARAGLSRAMIADPDRFIPGRSMSLLLEESARESGVEGFGLLVGEARKISGLGAFSLLFRHQRTLRDAIRVLIRYQRMLADTLVISLDEDDETALIRTDIVTDHHMTRQTIEATVAEMRRSFATITGGNWHPDSVHFVHPAPADLTIHRRVFDCPVQFEDEFNGISCTPASLDLPIIGAEPAIARYAEDSVERLAQAVVRADSATDRARRALYLLLPSGRGTLEHVGEDLGQHPRALQRALVREGTTFGAVLNDVRRELALRHLATPALSIEAIAVLVGYATLSSFSRWFTGEFGVAANMWRAGTRP